MKEQNAMSVFTGEMGMSSLDIAEITGKKHYNVMRDIRELLEQGLQKINFELLFKIRELPNGGKKKEPYYELTPKGCLILASGYDALLREKIINRLEALEKRTVPSYQIPDPIVRAQRWIEEQQEKKALEQRAAEQSEQIQVQSAQITELSAAVTEMKPKVSYVDTILQSRDTVSVTAMAQDYGQSAKAFNILLRNMRIQHKVGQQWIVYAKYLQCGYVQSETFTYRRSDGSTAARLCTKWTQKGRLFLYDTLKSHGIIPLIEQAAAEKENNENKNNQ